MSATETVSTSTVKMSSRLGHGSRIALIAGTIGLVIAGIGLILGVTHDQGRYVTSWLLGLAFWLSLGVGMLFITLIWYTFDACWPVVVRRQFEHAFSAFKYLLLCFLPLVLVPFLLNNPGILWEWMDLSRVTAGGETVGNDVLYQAKSAYLNPVGFIFRALLYFLIFIGLGEFLRKASFTMEKDGDARWVTKARVVAAIGIPFCAMAATFAAFDWFMSLQYHWFSTMYGVWFFASSVRAATAGAIVICVILMKKGPLSGGLFNRGHRYLLGCMLLAFTVFWAYITFSQYFLIYNANIPEETFWYVMRLYALDGSGLSGWGWILMSLVFFYFLFPFMMLLFYKTKVIVSRITFIAVWTLFFHLVDLYYNIVPRKIPTEVTELTPLGYSITPAFGDPLALLFDLGALVGIGGICVWAFLRSMNCAEVIPIRDPKIEESLSWHE